MELEQPWRDEKCMQILVGKLEGKISFVRPRPMKDDIKMDLKRHDVRVWSEFIWIKIGFCEHSNEPSGFVKDGTFLVQPLPSQEGLCAMLIYLFG
jgi:hypothetical protein